MLREKFPAEYSEQNLALITICCIDVLSGSPRLKYLKASSCRTSYLSAKATAPLSRVASSEASSSSAAYERPLENVEEMIRVPLSLAEEEVERGEQKSRLNLECSEKGQKRPRRPEAAEAAPAAAAAASSDRCCSQGKEEEREKSANIIDSSTLELPSRSRMTCSRISHEGGTVKMQQKWRI